MEEDRVILEGTEWLNDRIVQAAHNLLKAETNMDGFQNPLLSSRQLKPIKPGSPFLQILNINNNHWITVTNKVGELVFKDNVYIYMTVYCPIKLTCLLESKCVPFSSPQANI